MKKTEVVRLEPWSKTIEKDPASPLYQRPVWWFSTTHMIEARRFISEHPVELMTAVALFLNGFGSHERANILTKPTKLKHLNDLLQDVQFIPSWGAVGLAVQVDGEVAGAQPYGLQLEIEREVREPHWKVALKQSASDFAETMKEASLELFLERATEAWKALK